MERYTRIELADMHLAYGAAFTKGRAAQRLYRDRYPNRRITHHTTFSSIHRRLCQSRTVHRRVDGQGRGRFVRTPEAEEAVLQYEENNPSVSTRDIARTFMSHVTVWRILQGMLLRPYHLQIVHALTPADYPSLMQFCNWYLNQTILQADFANCVLFTDEACFTRERIYNSLNSHVWSMENPQCHDCAITSTSILCQCMGRDCR